jgi:hypothetical protein
VNILDDYLDDLTEDEEIELYQIIGIPNVAKKDHSKENEQIELELKHETEWDYVEEDQ